MTTSLWLYLQPGAREVAVGLQNIGADIVEQLKKKKRSRCIFVV